MRAGGDGGGLLDRYLSVNVEWATGNILTPTPEQMSDLIIS